MNELVIVKHNEVLTNSLIISQGAGIEHRKLKEQVRKYKAQIEQIGLLTLYQAESTGGRPEEFYELNEPQATFLITLLKNTTQVVSFKLELVRQFYQMRQMLQGRTQPPSLPNNNLLSLIASQERRIVTLEERLNTRDILTLPPPQTPVYATITTAQPKARMRTQAEVMAYIKEKDPNTALSPWALRKMVLTGQIPSVQVGRKRLIDLDTFEEYLSSPAIIQSSEVIDSNSEIYGKIRTVKI